MLGIPDKGAGTTAYDRFPRVASSRSNRTKHIDDMVTSRQHGYLCMADCTLGEVRNTAYRLGRPKSADTRRGWALPSGEA